MIYHFKNGFGDGLTFRIPKNSGNESSSVDCILINGFISFTGFEGDKDIE